MPYIPQTSRTEIALRRSIAHNAGELNYMLTRMCLEYWHSNGENYQAFNDVIGALEGCKLELYRRKVAPYEDVKKVENGDVYW